MSILVTVHREYDPAAVLADIHARGIEGHRIGNSRVLHVASETPAAFPLQGDPRIRAVEDITDDYVGFGAIERDAFSLPASLRPARGNWAVARHIRRDPPWDFRRHPAPFDTFFEAGLDGSGVDIYICDTGVRFGLAEFGGRASIVYDPGTTDNGDVNGHGTAVAALAAGGSRGFARGAQILSSKTMSNDNGGTTLSILGGLTGALDHYLSPSRVALNRPAVVNLSFGGSTAAISVEDVINEMTDAGMIVVAAAGNSYRVLGEDTGETEIYPALYPNVIRVGGSNAVDEPYQINAAGTMYGPNIDIVAAAQSIYLPQQLGMALWSGTSFAAPCVVGVLAMLLTGLPRLTSRAQVQQMRWHLRRMATQGRLTTVRARVNALPDRLLYIDPRRTTPISYGVEDLDPYYEPPGSLTPPNPSFESGSTASNAAISGWSETNTTRAAYDAVDVVTEVEVLPTTDGGTRVVRFDRSTTNSATGIARITTTALTSIPADKAEIVAAGDETLIVIFSARSTTLTDTPSGVTARAFFYDELGDFVSDVPYAAYQNLPVQDISWGDYLFSFPIPPMARQFHLSIQGRATPDERVRARIDNVRISYGSDTG